VGAVVGLARQGSRVPVLSLILAGVVIGSTFTAATSFLMLAARDRAAAVLARLLGSFGLAGWGDIVAVLPFLVLASLAILSSSRALNLLQLGDEQAAQLGLPVERVKLTLIVLATLATAAAVSVSGIIGFVGLLVPHAVRLGVGPDHRTLTPLALVLGALFMVLADLLARTVIAPAEIPIGVVTALAGGPFFLWLLRRRGTQS
jgi:iron complex transport system permease protein